MVDWLVDLSVVELVDSLVELWVVGKVVLMVDTKGALLVVEKVDLMVSKQVVVLVENLVVWWVVDLVVRMVDMMVVVMEAW